MGMLSVLEEDEAKKIRARAVKLVKDSGPTPPKRRSATSKK
jgi:hypothetical protein